MYKEEDLVRIAKRENNTKRKYLVVNRQITGILYHPSLLETIRGLQKELPADYFSRAAFFIREESFFGFAGSYNPTAFPLRILKIHG